MDNKKHDIFDPNHRPIWTTDKFWSFEDPYK
jgi:hypothetical protein